MKKFLNAFIAVLAAAPLFAEYDLKVTSTAGGDGIAKCGEKVTLTAQVFKDGKALEDSLVLHTVIKQEKTIADDNTHNKGAANVHASISLG